MNVAPSKQQSGRAFKWRLYDISFYMTHIALCQFCDRPSTNGTVYPKYESQRPTLKYEYIFDTTLVKKVTV